MDDKQDPKKSALRFPDLPRSRHYALKGDSGDTSALPSATASIDFTMAYTPLEIDNAYWQSGLLNSTFNLRLAANGGVTGLGYSWSILNGKLPPGLMLDNGTGVITGIPTAAGSYFVTIQVTDDGGDSTFKQFRILIYAQQPGGTNLALNKIYSSSSNWDANQTADKAFNGNLDTHWQAGSSGLAPGQGRSSYPIGWQ